jgi:hypothetical protein
MATRSRTVETYADGVRVDARTETYTTPVEFDNEETIRDRAAQALATNRTYIALANPTTAQNTAQVKALSRQMNGVVRLLLGLLDGTD